MVDLRLRHRARMRDKDAQRFAEAITEGFGISDPPPPGVERAQTGQADVLVGEGRILAIVLDEDRVAPSCRLLIAKRPTKAHVTVDMGAVKFVNNGADVMAPGITDADPAVAQGDLVWVRDEKNGVPLAVGQALLAGAAMPRGPKGKAVKNIHRVGDEYWAIEV